jgi:hypothetical protein
VPVNDVAAERRVMTNPETSGVGDYERWQTPAAMPQPRRDPMKSQSAKAIRFGSFISVVSRGEDVKDL